MKQQFEHTKNPRAVFDKFKLMWHIKGNYSIHEGKVKKSIIQKQVPYKTIELIQKEPSLDQYLRLRQDLIYLDDNGKTNISKTKENVRDDLIKLKKYLEEDMKLEGGFLDHCIENGFEHKQPPQPKLKRLNKRKQRKLDELMSLGLKKKTQISEIS